LKFIHDEKKSLIFSDDEVVTVKGNEQHTGPTHNRLVSFLDFCLSVHHQLRKII